MPLAIGTDTGGSIRVPTSFCGITAMKPTYGRVSRYGVMPVSWTLDHVGPMARSAADIALTLEVIAGHDPRDPASGTTAVGAYRERLDQDLRGMRIGVPTNWFFEVCDPEVERATLVAIEQLEGAGATAVPVRIPILDEFNAVTLLWLITNPESASLHDVNIDQIDLYSPDNQKHILAGRTVLAIDYIRALRVRSLIQREFETAFHNVDVIITPGTPSVAPRIERDDSIVDGWALIGDERHPWLEVVGRTTCVFNIVGAPALTVPSGLNSQGLPMSIQIAALPDREDLCLRVGHAFQQITRHHLLAPRLPVDRASDVPASTRALRLI
jgi:aspartyl-tRNA(Asn)/glutamyl-tRNA(Gln) amidotransferase subunit A